jgi:hypothetical protein
VTVVSINELRDSRPRALTPAECHALLAKASRYDGRTVGRENVEDWHEIAVTQRWVNLELAMAAITDYYGRAAKQNERLWIMPGHITEYLRTENRQPKRFDRAELEGAPPAADESRAAAIAQWAAAMARKKAIPKETA